MFNDSTPIKTKVLMEQQIIDKMCREQIVNTTSDKEVNDLVIREFTKSFNKEYSQLLPEQRKFLTHYISSDIDGGVDFKVFLNEELHRITDAVRQSLIMEEVKNDEEMVKATNEVLNLLEEYKNRDMNESDLKQFMKLQKLVSEYQSNAN